MTETKWMRERDAWVKQASDAELFDVIALLAQDSDLDDNLGDAAERSDTILWLATRGKEGEEWGYAARYAMTWSDDASSS